MLLFQFIVGVKEREWEFYCENYERNNELWKDTV